MVKISIDTTEDSHDHIKHVIAMLQNVVGNTAVTNAQPSSSDNSYVNIFAENPTPSEPTPEPTTPAEQSFFNIFGEDPNPAEPEPAPEPSPPSQVFGMPVAQAAPTTETPQSDQPTVQTVTPTRAPPTNAPPDIDMFDFFNKSKNQVKPY